MREQATMTVYTPAAAAETVKIGLVHRQIMRAWRRHKLLFFTCFFGVLVVGLAVLFTLQPRYSATTTVAISPQTMDPLANSQGQQQDDDLAATVSSMLQSREVAAAVLAQFPPPPAKPGLRDMLCHKGLAILCRPSATSEQQKEAQIDSFLTNLSVMPEGHSPVVDVSVTAPTAQRAATLADGLVQTYQQIALRQQTAQADRIADWLGKRSFQLQEDWLNAVQKADAYSISHNLTMASDGTTTGPLVDRQIGEVAASLESAQTQLANAQAEAAALHDASRHGNALALVTLQTQPVLVAAANTLMQLRNTRDQLASEFGPEYPKIHALDRQIATTQAELNAQAGSALASINENLVAAKAQVQQLSAQLAQLRAQATAQDSEESQYLALNAEAASAHTIYAAFLQHADDVQDHTSLQEPPVNVISAAGVPLQPIFPSRSKFSLGIFFLALVAGTGAALFREHSSESFGQADDLRASAQLPLLATLPAIPLKRGKSLAHHVLDEPYSRTSEALRGIAATLSLLAGEHAGARTVLVTSAGALEGKSTLATWLAITVRQTGHQVLLVDGDHRRGSLMQDGSAEETPGLTELLAGTAELADVIQVDPSTKVAFIASGAATARSSGSMDIAGLRAVFNALKKSYSLIVIDSPPLLAMVDGLVLGSLADQTVFVCRWNHSSRQAVLGSLERLRTYGARISGVVVSMMEPSASLHFDGEYGRKESLLINRFYGS